MTTINPLRLSVVTLSFAALYMVAVGHLFIIQIIRKPFFAQAGQRQYQVHVVQKPPRAGIYDRQGQPLTINKKSMSAFITPNNLSDKTELIDFLEEHFPAAYERLLQKPHSCFMYLKRRLSNDELALIEETKNNNIHLLQEESRIYPVPSLGTTIGVTDIDNQGLSGLELFYDAQLSGKATTYILEKDARSHFFYFTKEATEKGSDGTPLTLTIDADLQFIAHNVLQEHCAQWYAKEGGALIMDPETGELFALACVPDFDPNIPLPHDLSLTKNRLITEVHEFGSVMKVFTALAALEESVVTPDEIIDCEGRKETYINGQKITTWKAFGQLSYTDVIRKSNNIGTSKVALRIGSKLYEHLRRCGFGSPTGIMFAGEQKGYITPPERWSKPTPLHLSFGYEISATLVQLARGFALISNGGFLITPHLVKGEHQKNKRLGPLYSTRALAMLRSIIELNTEGNTAHKGHIPGYTVLGKTGSADLIINGHYDKNHSLYTFCGIIEKGSYKRIVAVFLKEPQQLPGKHLYAADIAVPLFKNIAEQMLVREKIAPL